MRSYVTTSIVLRYTTPSGRHLASCFTTPKSDCSAPTHHNYLACRAYIRPLRVNQTATSVSRKNNHYSREAASIGCFCKPWILFVLIIKALLFKNWGPMSEPLILESPNCWRLCSYSKFISPRKPSIAGSYRYVAQPRMRAQSSTFMLLYSLKGSFNVPAKKSPKLPTRKGQCCSTQLGPARDLALRSSPHLLLSSIPNPSDYGSGLESA